MKYILIGGSKGLGLELYNKLKVTDKCYTMNRSKGNLDLEWSAERITEAVKNGINYIGGCDVLLISSGLGAYFPPNVSADRIEQLFQVNVLGPMTVFRAAQKALLKSKGKAIFISSATSRKPSSGGLSYYAATKGSINSFVCAEARRQGKHGIAICSVSPGFFESPMTEDIHPKVKAASLKNIPMNRFGECEEIANFVIDLSKQTNWVIAGSNYECTGGA